MITRRDGAVLRVGVDCDHSANVDHLNELGRIAMKIVSRTELTDLEDIPNIGPAIADDLWLIGIASPQDLLGKDPYTMHDELCQTTGARHGLCELDAFIAAVRFMNGEPAKPWWKYTPERKRTLAAKENNKV